MNRYPSRPASLRRILSAVSVAALLALSPGLAGAADEGPGIAAYERGEFDAAYRDFQRAAETGDAVSQFNVGGMFFEGRGVERNMREAAFWFRKAAEQGVPLAQHGLAVLYYRGAGVARDYAEAARWFAKAAEQGVPNAQFNLGVLYYRGEGVQRDVGEMLGWIQKSADQGFMPAAYQLGVIYENGVGVVADPARALNWYQRAAAGGHPRARERVKSIIARTGLANLEDLPPMRAASREDARRNDALGGIPTFIRTAKETGHAAVPRADKPAVTMTDAIPGRPAPASQTASVVKPEPSRPAARPAEPQPAKPAATQTAAKPAEPPPAAKPAAPPLAPVKAAEPAPARPAEPSPTPAAVAASEATPSVKIPTPRPAEAAAKPADPAPVAVASATPAPRAGSRVFMVQLGSQPSEALARETWTTVSRAFPDALAGQTPVYKTVELSGRGTFTRVYLGPFEQRDQARTICANIHSRDSKQGCLVLSMTQ
ncbi:MAG: SPOR domain-containing protein [Rhodospirillales bacterium]